MTWHTLRRTRARQSQRRLAARLAAFTLIEMLTVIAIIGVLAGILIPTTRMVMQRARKVKAKSDITSALQTAITQYMNDFGAPPPDSNGCMDRDVDGNEPFGDMDTPNECLVWFLTRTYKKSMEHTTDFKHASTSGAGDIPEDTDEVWARVSGGPYLDITAKQRKDYDSDDFDEFVDSWGRPYQYRAYRKRAIEKIEVFTDSGNDFMRIFPESPVVPGIGTITIEGCADAANNFSSREEIVDSDPSAGFFVIQHTGVVDNSCDGTFEMDQLFNRNKKFDLYSVGPNGRTCGAANILMAPYGPEETSPAWGGGPPVETGRPAAPGNDVAPDAGGNLNLSDEKEHDDINNWSD